jgi:hypothetical protein
MAGGEGFSVDTATLTDTAAAVRLVADTQREHRLSELVGERASYGDDELQGAFAQFCSRWSDGLDVLTQDAATISDTLDSTVATYRMADELNGGPSVPGGGGVLE